MMRIEMKGFVLPFLKGLWIYTLILWGYIVADMFVFPQYQFDAISRLVPIPQNLVAIIAFPISFLAFVGWEYARRLDREARKSKEIKTAGEIHV
jgi:hypothetical protein